MTDSPPPVPTPAAASRPTTARERALAPDLARGGMLLLIALANASIYLYGRPYGPRGHLADGSALDHVWTFVQMLLIDGRAYPMFAALFGYGMVQFLDRRVAAGGSFDTAKHLLQRRSVWLLGFGFLHALLLFPGDILATYGLCGFLVVALLGRSDRLVLGTASALLPVIALLGAVMALEFPDPTKRAVVPSLVEPAYLTAAGGRVLDWLGVTLAQLLLVLTPMLFGVWAARRRLLDDPAAHRALLRSVAVIGLAAAVVGGLPLALAAAQVWNPPVGLDLVFGVLHTLGGTAGGLGYAALIGIVTIGVTRRGPVLEAVVALGQRSLTFYLFQS
ncbi:MAG TPA: DUF418 domain-containing protein, partial [Actinopolymorphaceae bacterium]